MEQWWVLGCTRPRAENAVAQCLGLVCCHLESGTWIEISLVPISESQREVSVVIYWEGKASTETVQPWERWELGGESASDSSVSSAMRPETTLVMQKNFCERQRRCRALVLGLPSLTVLLSRGERKPHRSPAAALNFFLLPHSPSQF